MKPSKKLIKVLFVLTALGGLVFAARLFGHGEALADLWWLAAAMVVFACIWDFWRLPKRFELEIERELPHNMALGVRSQIDITLINKHDFPLKMELTDYYPDCVDAVNLPVELAIEGNSKKVLSYHVLPAVRGEAAFGQTWVMIFSQLGLWQKTQKLGIPTSTKIYPNFAPIFQSAGIGLEHQIAQMGVHMQHRRGEGSDFHQLREFREGDSLRQIDWNATSRYRKPISREYQDEQDQEVIFLLDSGRSMRSKEEGRISHFDHALNALILTSYIALRQGDAVGIMSFGSEKRYIAPMKSPTRINHILNQLYDLQSDLTTSDYLSAAQHFLSYRNKRALVILITNVREEDTDDLVTATRLLSNKHKVMVASLRDMYFDNLLSKPVNSFNDALSYCGTLDSFQRRSRLLSKLQKSGVVVADSTPTMLHIQLVKKYLFLKRCSRF
ncbi:DUF58 domain-containing protein [Marinomonas sp. THO17]|uniref:DUF58 domain-containing protein n=1 Tax=Marinomonas sp. THO17 TaxID=3149048 RepID=UPI00336BD3A4